MKHFKHYLIIATLALVISACGAAEATQSIDPLNVQSTAVAAAFTIVAETQAAIPTATPLPPTDTPVPTPLPTDTLIPLPTLEESPQASLPTLAPTSVSASDNSCNGIVSKTVTGKPTRIRIVNETKHAGVKVWLYLNLTAFGECGYFPIYSTLGKNNGDYFLDAVQGSYSIGAWTDNGKLNVSGGGSINNPDKWTFHIRDNNIILTPP